eukprot:COSAG06_NODE_531_length_14564_cov_23.708400_11_plen_66_part_00
MAGDVGPRWTRWDQHWTGWSAIGPGPNPTTDQSPDERYQVPRYVSRDTRSSYTYYYYYTMLNTGI